MIFSWWTWWFLFMVIILMMPVGYGWGYRGWGVPYPSYWQRRRQIQYAASTPEGGAPLNHYAWGWGGDLLWVLFVFWIVWAVTAYWWR